VRGKKQAGKSYIGSSVDLARRFSEYYMESVLNRDNMLIYKVLLGLRPIWKHGHSNFSLEILEYCEQDNVVAREQHYLDNLPLLIFFTLFPPRREKKEKN
jgi:group I intron endonuclease